MKSFLSSYSESGTFAESCSSDIILWDLPTEEPAVKILLIKLSSSISSEMMFL